MTAGGGTSDEIQVRVSLGLVVLNLSLAILTGTWALRLRRAPARACAPILGLAPPIAFVTLAVVELTVPLFVVEPDRVRRNHRLFRRQVRITGLDDLRLGKRTLRRRSDGRLIEMTLGARREDIARLRRVAAPVEQEGPEPDGPR